MAGGPGAGVREREPSPARLPLPIPSAPPAPNAPWDPREEGSGLQPGRPLHTLAGKGKGLRAPKGDGTRKVTGLAVTEFRRERRMRGGSRQEGPARLPRRAGRRGGERQDLEGRIYDLTADGLSPLCLVSLESRDCFYVLGGLCSFGFSEICIQKSQPRFRGSEFPLTKRQLFPLSVSSVFKLVFLLISQKCFTSKKTKK